MKPASSVDTKRRPFGALAAGVVIAATSSCGHPHRSSEPVMPASSQDAQACAEDFNRPENQRLRERLGAVAGLAAIAYADVEHRDAGCVVTTYSASKGTVRRAALTQYASAPNLALWANRARPTFRPVPSRDATAPPAPPQRWNAGIAADGTVHLRQLNAPPRAPRRRSSERPCPDLRASMTGGLSVTHVSVTGITCRDPALSELVTAGPSLAALEAGWACLGTRHFLCRRGAVIVRFQEARHRAPS